MGTHTLVALFLASAVQPPGSPAAAPPSSSDARLRGEIDALLGSRDGAISPEQWRRLGPAASPLLEEIVNDRDGLSTRRGRAVEGLIALRSPRLPVLLPELSRSEAEPFLVRAAALRGAARALSPRQQLSALRPVLEKAGDVRLRELAAEILSQHGSGCPAVQLQAKREAAEVKDRFEAAVRRCESR